MLVQDVMTTPVLSVEPETPIADAAKLMLVRHVSGLPVVRKDGTLAGVVSEGDFLRRSEIGTEQKRGRWLEFIVAPEKKAAEYIQSHGRKVADVMSADPVTIARDASLDQAVELMTGRRIKRLPVVENGRVVGIISRSDVLRALAVALPATEAQADDARIKSDILEELERQSWCRHGLVRIRVEDGAVELSGAIYGEHERAAIRVAAENVAGVKSVTDKMVWIEPLSGIVIMPPSPDEASGRPGGAA